MAHISQAEYERWAATADAEMARARAMQSRRRPRADTGPTRDFRTGLPIRLSGQTLTHAGQERSVRGVVARVDGGGSVAYRTTVTRAVGFGLLPGVPALAALLVPKKVDHRQLWLTVTGPDFEWSIPASPGRADAVRALAADINTAARRLDAASS